MVLPDPANPTMEGPQLTQITAIHLLTRHTLTWTDGHFDGDPDLVAAAGHLCESRERVGLSPTGPWVDTDASDPVAVVAIFDHVFDGRAVLSGDIPEAALHELAGLEEGEIG